MTKRRQFAVLGKNLVTDVLRLYSLFSRFSHAGKLNGHDPFAYLKDVLTRLPTQRANQVNELLPHRWQPQS